MRYTLKYLDKIYPVELKREGGLFSIEVDDKRYEIKNLEIQGNLISFQMNDKRYQIYGATRGNVNYITIDGEYYTFSLEDEKRIKKKDTGAGGDAVSSPMPGLVVKIPVKVGDKVSAGATLVIVEAMKMQNELKAPRDGVVKRINFKEGEQIDAFTPIVELS